MQNPAGWLVVGRRWQSAVGRVLLALVYKQAKSGEKETKWSQKRTFRHSKERPRPKILNSNTKRLLEQSTNFIYSCLDYRLLNLNLITGFLKPGEDRALTLGIHPPVLQLLQRVGNQG
jgi:hypothetical protein